MGGVVLTRKDAESLLDDEKASLKSRSGLELVTVEDDDKEPWRARPK
ncbi:hypothetical protein C1H76_2557 [Elsinoe australis]|uniref:Uncharacterized protein n=1 Tax=Elsinoe australis TaxID=40998 RepID=A0A4U7BAQ6_9PEZI|nr:hypothetical protein C1H76_2557 [Elsinoe australis]